MKMMVSENVIFDSFLLYQFIKKMVTPFKEKEAYKLGIIDAQGNVLKKRSELLTSQEKNAFGIFDVFVNNIKKIIEKVPFGRSKLASFATALFLLKEEHNAKYFAEDVELLEETFLNFVDDLDSENLRFLTTLSEVVESCCGSVKLITEEDFPKIERRMFFLQEEVAANNAGSGEVAGLGTDGELPLVPPKKKKKKQLPA